jgi:predicted TIM-barrel fold metal-dependent hydrolase
MVTLQIDFHTHLFESFSSFFPKSWADEAFQLLRFRLGEDAFEKARPSFETMGRVEELIKAMDEAGIDKSVALPLDYGIMSHEEAEVSVWRVNEYVAEAQKRYPDRIIGFVGVDPLRPDAVELLETGVTKWGLKGVKLFPSTFQLTDLSVQKFFAKANELEIPVLCHQGTDPLPYIAKHGSPVELDELTLYYPKMKLIAAHCSRGWERLLIAIAEWRRGIIYTDLSGLQTTYLRSTWWLIMLLRHLMDMIPDLVLMGSDWPFVKTLTTKQWFDTIRNLQIPEPALKLGLGIKNFSQEEKNKILGENAKVLLHL